MAWAASLHSVHAMWPWKGKGIPVVRKDHRVGADLWFLGRQPPVTLVMYTGAHLAVAASTVI